MFFFVKKIAIFLSFLLLLFIGVEVYLSFFESAFQIKAKYAEKNKASIGMLVLGSSHNQNSINPDYLTYPSANIAFGGQDLHLDWLLLSKEIKLLSNLKIVLFELSYHSLEMKNQNWYERNPLYLRFYNINNFGRQPNIMDYSIFLSNPKLYLKILNPLTSKTKFNKYGFETQIGHYGRFNEDRFKMMNYDTSLILSDTNNIFISRHKYQDLKTYRENCMIFNQMVDMCVKNNITPMVVITPVYKSYYQQMIPAKKNRRDNFLFQMTKKFPKLQIINYENSNRFKVIDFKNEDHLNPQGAKKFSLIIDSILTSRVSNN